MGFQKQATVVMVHGAWADGSSWGSVINSLDEAGLKVMCAPIPLTSLSDDIATLKAAIGPHKWTRVACGSCVRRCRNRRYR
jgi:hypothetical protein